MKKHNFTSADFNEIELASAAVLNAKKDLKEVIISKLKKLVRESVQNNDPLEIGYLFSIRTGELVVPVVELFMEGEDLMFKLDMDIQELEIKPAIDFEVEDLLEFFYVLSWNMQ